MSGGRAPRRNTYSRDDYGSDRRNSRRDDHRVHSDRDRSRENHLRGPPLRRHEDRLPHVETTGTDMIKVSGTSHTKSVAGKIAHDTRANSHPPTVLAVGAASINVAMKAIAVARSYMIEEDTDISCQPAFREGMSDLAMALYLHSVKGNRYDQPAPDSDELVAKGTTIRKDLAGAIAQRVRNGDRVHVKAHGSAAVAAAVGAICKARTYLEEDHLDLHCSPKFMSEEMSNGQTTTFLRLELSTETS